MSLWYWVGTASAVAAGVLVSGLLLMWFAAKADDVPTERGG